MQNQGMHQLKIKLNARLPPEVNRIIYVRNLPPKATPEELYDIFGKYGAIRQIRKGNTARTRGCAFIIYEDIFEAKEAVDKLNGFNVAGKYLICLYYQQAKITTMTKEQAQTKQRENEEKKEKLNELKKEY